jgi:hypothetical protein
MMKYILSATVLFSTSAFAETVVTRVLDDATVCKAIAVPGESKSANRFQGLKVYRDNQLVREVGLRNNVWQLPEDISLDSNCNVNALYPVYNGRFQNLFKNGNFVKDLPLIQ